MNAPTARLVLAAALVVGGLAACSSDDGDDASSDVPSTEATTTTTEATLEPLTILVSNDDGYDAEGIDALVEGLLTLDEVEVIVVAPLDQRSATGGSSTDGELATTDVETASGYETIAVDGFPADAVRVAIDDLGIEPDLVLTGINEGQNLGPLVDISGTVGAARAGVARGIPAFATSQGLGDDPDYDVAVPMILEWVEEHRDALADGSAPVEVTSLNIPTCDEGELRGLLEIEPDLGGDGAPALQPQDCTSTIPEGELTTDVEAFLAGFATIAVIPSEPAT